MYYADATDATLQVSIELADLRSALLNLPVVRSDLSDERVPAEARIKLLFALIGEDANLNKVTMRLAEPRDVQPAQPQVSVHAALADQQVLPAYGRIDGHRDHRGALNQGQIDRLIAIYTKKVGRPVHINSTVDPTVIGGMRIEIGDEVTDNTVVAQLEQLQRKVKAGTRP